MSTYPPPIRWLAASLIALVLSSAWLLDGPSEIDAAQAVSGELPAAIESVAASVRIERATWQIDHQTILAVQP